MRVRLLAALFGIGLASVAAFAVAADEKQPPPQAAPATSPPGATANSAEPSKTQAPAEGSVASTTIEPAKPGDPAAGQAKSAACAACHGMDGNSADPQYPKLAGQHERYIARMLALFKAGERENPVMQPFAATLSPQDMRDIGAYFASKTALPGLADDSVIHPENPAETYASRGQGLYRGGRRETGLPACMACHGPTGRGNPGPAYPEIGGQHSKYTKDMLTRFRSGVVLGKAERANPIMAQVAAQLSDEDITALASYLEGLHRATASDVAPAAAAPTAPTAAPAAH